MNRFIQNIIIGCLVLFCTAILADVSISKMLRKSNYRIYYGYNYIYNDTTYHDLVINGSSRAWVHYDPYILDSILCVNSFNLGIDGSAINRQMIKYDRFVEYHGYPKYLIQNIDLFTMNTTIGYEKEQYYPYFFFDKTMTKLSDYFENYPWAYKYLPLYRYFGFNEKVLKYLSDEDLLYKGYKPQENKYDGSILNQMSKVEMANDTSMVIAFSDFLQNVTQNGTKVLFVYAPIYIEARRKMINEQQMFDMYDSIASKFDIPILDYNNDAICYDTAYFYNATHLNKQGAELFTTKLAHDIDSIGFLK